MTAAGSSILDLAEAFAVTAGADHSIVGYAWRRPPAGRPALLFAHANGFNAGCYVPFLQRLAGDFRLFACDLRGHGRSTGPDPRQPGAYDLARLAAEDLAPLVEEVRRRLGPDAPLHFAAHSVGGHVGVLHQARRDAAPFASMTLFEPPIYPGHDHPLRAVTTQHTEMFARWAERRSACYATAAEWEEAAAAVGNFSGFAPDMRQAYLRAAVAPEPDGRLRLRCPGPVEGQIYRTCAETDAFRLAQALRLPVRVYTSDPRVRTRGRPWLVQVLGEMASAMPAGSAHVMTGLGHLMIMEDPDRCAEAVRAHALHDAAPPGLPAPAEAMAGLEPA